jgi:hypothetical protein
MRWHTAVVGRDERPPALGESELAEQRARRRARARARVNVEAGVEAVEAGVEAHTGGGAGLSVVRARLSSAAFEP